MSTRRTTGCIAAAATVVLVSALAAPRATASPHSDAVAGQTATRPAAAPAAAPVLPSSDPFYTYSGSTPLAQIAPGTVLAKRAVSISLNTASTPAGVGVPLGPVETIPGEQLLYRTADELGNPSATVTTVVTPAATTATSLATPPDIVAYLSFYDSLAAKCDPSYTLTGGDPDTNNTELTDLEQGLVAEYYSLGYVVTIPDFEGTNLDWTAGHEAGYGTLDAVRATESYLGTTAAAPVGLTGYSGGSIAADWASELAPTYAPSLNIVGVAEGGIPVDFAHNLTYIDGSAEWSGIEPAVLDALSRSYGVDLSTYLSDYGKQLTDTDRDECIGDFNGSVPGLTIAKLLKPQYADVLQQPAFVNILNSLIMGSEPGHPAGPLFMAVGNDPQNAQGQGDDIMVTDDVVALAHEYCGQGVTVQYSEYTNSTHDEAALQFEPAATEFLEERFAGAPPTNDCGSIGVGNSLAPIVLAPASTSAATTTASTSSTHASGTTAKPKATARRATVAQPQRTLAYTGLDVALPLAALALVLGGLGSTRARRRRARL